MRKRLKKIEAEHRVVCGNFNMIPTCVMKFVPLLRICLSSSGFIPSRIEGVCSSSSSVYIHWRSASASTSVGSLETLWSAISSYEDRRDVAGRRGIKCDDNNRPGL